MSHDPHNLSRRERQIMEVIWRNGEASAADVLAGIPDPPSYSAVRALLRILVDKGHLRHRQHKGRYIYTPTRPRDRAARTALKRVLHTFFDNSTEKAVAALLESPETQLSEQQLNRLSQLIEQARNQGV
jgi:predicted transcriptional regulator